MPAVETERFLVAARDGRRLEVSAAGPADGRPVIQHHGTPGSAHGFWPPHVELAVERGVRLIAYSRPGYAGSDRHSGRAVRDCAADAAAIADAIGAERFFTVGGSGGGPHALACAALLGDRVIAAATVAGAAPFDAEGLDWLEGMGEENHQEIGAAVEGPEKLKEFLAAWEPQLRQVRGPDLLEAFGDLVSGADAAVLTGEYAEFAAGGMRNSMSGGTWGWFDDDLAFIGNWGFDPASIGVPVTVWQGLDDRFVPAAHSRWLAAHVGGADARLLEGQGHLSLALGRYGEILDSLLAAEG